MQQETYAALMAHVRQTVALSQISGLVGWDQETMMPRGAATQRGEWSGAIEAVIHQRRTDPRIGDWLAALEGSELDEVAQANLVHIRRSYDRNTKVPGDLAAEIARVTSVAQGVWAEARRNNDFAAFAPTLKRVLELRRQEAAALSDGDDPYDALLDDYEPGMTGTRLDQLLGNLRKGLIRLRDRIRGTSRDIPALSGKFDHDRQIALAREMATTFGYDWNRGRLDKAVHPFSSGSGDDCRITTRVDEANPFDCLYSTIHETGHACYEQNINRDFMLTPLGRGASMGVHESQSRIYENQLGRSRAFTGYLFGRMRAHFGDFGVANEDDFHALVNAVGKGYIRTEADEVQYNLHILLRYELEREMILGRLEVDDLEEAWNSRFERDFGFAVDKPANGVLQDVHWSVGLFGYFPTYSLGNIYAGMLHAALRREVSDLDDALSRGDTSAATTWLRDKVQHLGGLYEPAKVISRAAGQAISEKPLLAYLEEKYAAIYDL